MRSGVLVSVHSFAADPSRGIFILVLLVLMIGGALGLYAWRAPLMKSSAGFDFVSRESFLLFNNILLTIAAAVVFGGTLAPLISDTVGLGTLSVGPPYFNPSFLVPILPMLSLVALGMHARWRRGGLGEKRPLLVALGLALVLGLALSLGVYAHPLKLTPIGATVGLWIILSSLIDPIDECAPPPEAAGERGGMSIAHIGLGVFVLGITFVQSNTIERDIALKPGESAQLGAYQFRYEGGENIVGPNYEGFRGTGDHHAPWRIRSACCTPRRRRYWVQGTVQTTAAIAAGLRSRPAGRARRGCRCRRLEPAPAVSAADSLRLGGRADHGDRRRHRRRRAAPARPGWSAAHRCRSGRRPARRLAEGGSG